MFVHKPLCEKYVKDSISLLGIIYFCRSCFFLYLGALLGFAIGFGVRLSSTILFALAICTIFVVIISYPPIYKYNSRLMRDIVRFLAGLLCACLTIYLFRVNLFFCAFEVLFLICIKELYNKKRNPDKICAGCKELGKNKACSGYRKQTDALLELEENFSKHLTIRKELLDD